MLNFIHKYLRDKISENIPLSTYELVEKPMYIEDSYTHVSKKHGYVGFTTYYNLLKRGVKSLEVRRKPFLGIYSQEPKLGDALHRMLTRLDVSNIYLGDIIRKDDIYVSIKMVDYLLLIHEKPPDLESIDINGFIYDNNTIGIYEKNSFLIIYSNIDILDVIVASMYITRPLQYVLFQYPYKMNITIYPEEPPRLKNGIYPIKLYDEAGYRLDQFDYNGILVKYNNKYFIEMIY